MESPMSGSKRVERMASGQKPDPNAVYRLKVTLRGSKPPIWRRLQVSAGMTLNSLDQVLQIVMGWQQLYAYEFDDGLFWYGQDFTDDFGEFVPGGEDDTKTRLCDVIAAEKDRFRYNYRLDPITLEGVWQLDIQLEQILPGSDELRIPRCLEGSRAAPPEDHFGGIKDYEGCLLSFRDAKDPRQAEAREILGDDFDPDAFKLEEINGRLARFDSFQRQPELWQRESSEVLLDGPPPAGGRWVYGTRSRKR